MFDFQKKKGDTTDLEYKFTLKVKLFSYFHINPHVTKRLSHVYHLDVSTLICRGVRSSFSFLFHFSLLRLHIWGYSVCLCPIKRTPGLYGLIT